MVHRWVVTVLVLVIGGCGKPPPVSMPVSAKSKLLDRELPSFRRPTLGGEMFDTKTTSGRVVVVKFFAEYCRPQKTLQEAQALHRLRRDIAVIGISEDEDRGSVWDQVKRYELTFPVIYDGARVLAGRFRVTELPMTFVADKSGRIVWVGGPENGDRGFRQAVEAARNPAKGPPRSQLEWCPCAVSTARLLDTSGRLSSRRQLPVGVVQQASRARPCHPCPPSSVAEK